MSKYINDANNLELQKAAFEAAKEESSAMDLYLDGKITESQYISCMESTKIAVDTAVKHGVSIKDLPAV